jgi:hypothetical protein
MSSWLQIQRSGFDSRRYQIFWEVVGLERVHSALWVQLRSYLEEKVAAPVWKSKNTAVGIRHSGHMALSISENVGTDFAHKRLSLGRYSSIAD